MRLLRTIRLRVRSLFRPRRVDEDLDAELRGHLERQIELHGATGLSPADARAAALREFGNIAVVQEQCRDTRRVNWIEDLRRDPAYALRSMRQAPGFTAVAILSATIGEAAHQPIGRFVSGNFFEVLGVSPAVGRTRARDDDRSLGAEGSTVTVIGYGLWQREFGGGPAIVGTSLMIDKVPFTTPKPIIRIAGQRVDRRAQRATRAVRLPVRS